MIDGFLWLLHDIDNTVLAAECYVSNIINRGCSTRKKWANQEFTNVNWILFPMNLSSDHWTLLVSYSSYIQYSRWAGVLCQVPYSKLGVVGCLCNEMFFKSACQPETKFPNVLSAKFNYIFPLNSLSTIFLQLYGG